MVGTILVLAASAVGVEPGWEKLEGGGWRYHIQIDNENLKALMNGEPLESDIPPQLWDIRTYRITLGGKPTPRDPLPDLSGRPRAQTLPGPAVAASEPARPHVPGPSAAERIEGPSLGWPGPGAPPSEGPKATEGPRPYEEQTLARPRLEPQDVKPEEPAKPWLPLTIATAAAFGCFGGMLYAGWIAWDYRRRYQQLFAEMIEAGLKAEG